MRVVLEIGITVTMYSHKVQRLCKPVIFDALRQAKLIIKAAVYILIYANYSIT